MTDDTDDSNKVTDSRTFPRRTFTPVISPILFPLGHFPGQFPHVFLPISRNALLPLQIPVLITQHTEKTIPLKLLLPIHQITSSRPLTMVKPASQYALASVQPSTP